MFGFNHGKLLRVDKNGDVLVKIRPEIESRIVAILGAAKFRDLQVYVRNEMFIRLVATDADAAESTAESTAVAFDATNASSESGSVQCFTRWWSEFSPCTHIIRWNNLDVTNWGICF